MGLFVRKPRGELDADIEAMMVDRAIGCGEVEVGVEDKGEDKDSGVATVDVTHKERGMDEVRAAGRGRWD